MDVHAEATGEKGALGYAYDGRISVIFGTHTHVPTCDQIILPSGTGYITDVGMCGETGGVLGMDPAIVVKQLRTRMPIKLEPATGAPRADGVIFDLDEKNGKVRNIERISF
jgi:calcineurin-like phosphoesterase